MDVLTLHADNPGHMTGGGNWTYLIDGAAPVLIDAGVGQPRHLDALFAARAARAGDGAGHARPSRPRLGGAGDRRPRAAGAVRQGAVARTR